MKKVVLFIILFLSVCLMVFGIIKDIKRVRELGYGGIIFLSIVLIIDFLDFL